MMPRALPRVALALALAVGTAAPAFAQTPPPPGSNRAAEAGAHFKRGIDLYGEADYTNALIEFRRAYEIDPKFQALYNIGETYFQLQDYANALQTLERYLRDGGAQVPPQRREEVQRDIDKLRTRVATLEVTTSVPDVDIAFDDATVGKTPLAGPVVVSAGRHKITATKGARAPITQIVELAGGDTRKVAITIPDEGTGPLAPPGTEPPARPPAKVPVAPWVVTGVLGAGAIVTGSLALGAWSDAKSDLKVYPNANPSQISSDHSKTFALGVTTDVLIGASVVAAAISIYFTVAASSQAQGDKDKAAPKVSWQPLGAPGPMGPRPPAPRGTLLLQASPQSVELTGSF